MTSRPSSEFPAISPATYLDLANELARQPDPAARRTAGDRAYYAAFLSSRDQLAAKGYITPYYTSDDHMYVSRALRGIQGALGILEVRLRRARNELTYNTRDLTHDMQDVQSLQWMLDTAKRIIEAFNALPNRRG